MYCSIYVCPFIYLQKYLKAIEKLIITECLSLSSVRSYRPLHTAALCKNQPGLRSRVLRAPAGLLSFGFRAWMQSQCSGPSGKAVSSQNLIETPPPQHLVGSWRRYGHRVLRSARATRSAMQRSGSAPARNPPLIIGFDESKTSDVN